MIKFEIQIDPADGRQLEAASQFLAALAGKTDKVSSKEVEAPEAEPEPETEPEPEPTKAPAKKKKATLKKVEKAKAPEPEPEEEEDDQEEAEDGEGEITLDDLRAIVAEKAKLHKEALRAKLSKMGAKNVPTLAPSKFAEFYEYAKSLK